MLRATTTTGQGIRWIAVAVALPLVGCMTQSRSSVDIDRTPIVNTGARATIIYPGEGPVPMPGTAPRGSNPQPNAASPGNPSSGGGMVFLGGARTDETYHRDVKEDPLVVKYLMAPLALAAAPFVMAKKALEGEAKPGPAIPRPAEPTVPQSRRAAAPREQPSEADGYETAMLQNMEAELAQRQTPDQRAVSAARRPSSAAPRTSASSIEDELQALRRTPALPRSESERAVAPPRAVSRVNAGKAPGSPGFSATRSAAPSNTDNPYPTAHGIVDRNDDGHIDQWIFRENGEISRQIFDEDYDGRPDRTILFDPKTHQPSRVEEDSSGDGALDSWVDYHDGVIQRRRADGDGDGVVDTWSFYRAGELVRHEQDTSGDGFRDTISFFSEGRRVREQRDTNSDGQLNAILHYDSGNQLTHQEEDRDGDGNTDVISHYKDGRLTRRELLQAPEVAEGLSSDAPLTATP